MYILGAGAAYPTTFLDRDVLISLAGVPDAGAAALIERVGARSIATTLPVDYIEKTGNKNVFEAWKAASHSPTDLGHAAAAKALAIAGIGIEQVGLVLGTTSTPYQSCPSEAQRITGKFGVKIPCYDIVGGMAAVPLYIETLMSWKLERLPDFILCVFTDVPTQYVNYSNGGAAPFIFGDAASAMIVSPRTMGKLKIVGSYLKKNSSQKPILEIDRTVRVAAENLLPVEEVREMTAACISKVEEQGRTDRSRLFCVGPEFLAGDNLALAGHLGISPDNMRSSTLVRGYSIGSAPLCAVADAWDSIKSGDSLALVHGGDGVWSSSLLCACE